LQRIDTQPIEFHVIDGRAGIEAAEWEQFEIRFDRSAQSVGFSSKTAHALQGALHEMADNAVIHAQAPVGVLVGYAVEENMATFSVADVGIGVLATLRSHPAYEHLELHKDAIRTALQDGTSRFGPNTRGLGFRQIFKALAAQWGHLRFRSGNGCVTLNGHGLDADKGEETFPPHLPGFQVTVCCRTSAPSAQADLL
jgi:anti-sigma regulatory factor (Ser/Thr protein kinase)